MIIFDDTCEYIILDGDEVHGLIGEHCGRRSEGPMNSHGFSNDPGCTEPQGGRETKALSARKGCTLMPLVNSKVNLSKICKE
jgi:hypothetical protein